MNSNAERKAQGKQVCEVIFLPEKKKATVQKGTTLLEAAGLAGVYINSLCGGEGGCGECKLKVRKGAVGDRSKYLSMLSKEEFQEGYVLPCQTPVEDDLEVEVPPGVKNGTRLRIPLEKETILLEIRLAP